MTVYGRRGNLIRILYLIGAIIWYLLTIGGRLGCGKIVVLCYHGIRPEQGQRFETQMTRLGRRLPNIRITFDDAFENLLDNALPLLNKLRIPAIVFAVPGNFGQSPQWNIAAGHPEYNEKVMTAQQLKNICGDLITIGSHTQTHRDLSKLSGEEVRWELTESRKNLEQLLQKPVEDLALPHGSYNQDVLRIAQDAGYKRIYSLDPILLGGQKKEGLIGRFSMSPDVWPLEFYLTCAGAYQWLGPWRRMIRALKKSVYPIFTVQHN